MITESHNERAFKAAILAKSCATTWELARHEWALDGITWDDKPHQCVCRHRPIHELCFVSNTVTGEEVIVGNVCVNKFMLISTSKLFAALNRITADTAAAANLEMVAFAVQQSWITEGEGVVYYKQSSLRKLWKGDLRWRKAINHRIIRGLSEVVADRLKP